MKKLCGLLLMIVALASCQKEIDWGLNSGADGDLLVKSVEVTPATNDTNIVLLTYDGQKRLIEYNSAGKVNGIQTNISHKITRLTDGKISRIVSKTGGGFIDSTVYLPFYDGDKLSYVIDTQYTTFMNIRDSVKYTFNSLGLCTEMERFTDVLGTMDPVSKQTFVYDASGNPLTEMLHTADPGGGYTVAVTTSYTYNGRKSAVTLGDESLIVLPITSAAKNDMIKQEINSLAGPDLTYNITGQIYNNNNRPRQHSISVTPQPPGYDVKVTHYYQ